MSKSGIFFIFIQLFTHFKFSVFSGISTVKFIHARCQIRRYKNTLFCQKNLCRFRFFANVANFKLLGRQWGTWSGLASIMVFPITFETRSKSVATKRAQSLGIGRGSGICRCVGVGALMGGVHCWLVRVAWWWCVIFF